MTILFLDWETFFDDEFSLSRKDMTTQKYIHDSRFKVHGVGVARLTGPGQWITGKLCDAAVRKLVPEATVICHNAPFDVGILAFHYGVFPKRVIDTESLSRAMIGATLRSHSLDSVAKKLLGYGKTFGLSDSKGVRDLNKEQEASLANYCVHDAHSDINITREIFKRLIRFFPVDELPVMDWCCRAFTEPKLILREDVLSQYYDEVVAKKAEVLREAGLENRDMLMSNDKYAEGLRALGVEPPTKISPTTGKVAYAFAKTDEAHKALLEHESPSVQALVAARLESKSTIEETRAAKYLEASRLGPWPVHYKFSGALQTHRFSGSDGAGGNPQNLKRGGTLRDAIEAPDGHQLIVGDLRQIEARVTMALAGETEALDAFRADDAGHGQDPYCWFGEKLYCKAITKKANPLERQISKSAFLGCGFGAGDVGLQRFAKGSGIDMTDEQAASAVKVYRTAFPGVPRLWRIAERALEFCERGEEHTWPAMKPLYCTGHEPLLGVPGMKAPGGLWIKYPELRRATMQNTSDKYREKLKQNGEVPKGEWIYTSQGTDISVWGGLIIENVVQYTARKILMDMLVDLNKYFPIAMTTHDELIGVVADAKVEVAKRVMKKVMSTSPAWWLEIPLSAEVSSAKSYGSCK